MLPEVISAAPETRIPGRVGTARAFLRLLSCIRFEEVLLLNGPPLLGAIFAIGNLTAERAAAVALLAAANCCLVAHVFLLNDWSGINADLKDANRTTGVFTTKGVGRTEIGYLWMALLGLSLLLLSPFGLRTLIIAVAIAGLSGLYSAGRVDVKGVPIFNSLLHFTGGILHFLLGYSLFRAVDARGLEVGCFFALTFVAGHLTHESRDRDADLLNGIKTNAVRFGKASSFAAGFAIFTIAYVLLVMLATRGTVPRALLLVAAAYPLHLYWSIRAVRAGLTFESIRWLQVHYRWLYAVIGFMMLVTLLQA
jgi:4-hydroxybenzoate polyprenyltransferase